MNQPLIQAVGPATMTALVESHWFVLSLVVLDIALRVVLAVRVILRRLQVPTALAWLVVLFFLPFVSPFLYLLVGENRLGSRRARVLEAAGREQHQMTADLWRLAAVHPGEADQLAGCISRLCTSVSGYPPMPSNTLRLMDDATEVLRSIEADIDAAKHHCHLLYYIWQPEEGGLRVAEALMRAVKRGVKCRVLVDAVGSKAFLASDLFDRMKQAGVRVEAALPANPIRMLFARIDLRNHRKITVVDGRVAYCGSQNLTDESFRASRNRRVGPWIDGTVRIEGHAVHPLQAIFLQDWFCESDEELMDPGQFFPEPDGRGGTSIVHVVPSGPGPQPATIHHALLAMIHGAREEIVMTTPYFVPDEPMKAALLNAALRGVSVTLVVPDMLDARVVAAASRSHYEDLLEAGVTILHHEGGLLHAKTATIDRTLALVTSANLDIRSFWLNFEVSMFVYDDDFAGMLRFLQTKYVGESRQIHLDEWRRRPIWRRLVDNTAQLFGPLL
jgi:cardiolipin synthase